MFPHSPIQARQCTLALNRGSVDIYLQGASSNRDQVIPINGCMLELNLEYRFNGIVLEHTFFNVILEVRDTILCCHGKRILHMLFVYMDRPDTPNV